MGDLTRNFSLDEFLVSSTADRLGIPNTPTQVHLDRLKTVTAPSMQVVRDLINRSVVITSAYRNPQINASVGGTETSAHPQGWAVDSHAAGLSSLAYARLLAAAMAEGGALHGKVDQLIYEIKPNIVHISFDPRHRGQIRTQRKGPKSRLEIGINA